MPLDKENRRLYVDYANGYGISLIDVANCLRDFRRDKNGNIDLGMMCTSPHINIWALFRPYLDFNNIIREATMEDRKNSNYGLIANTVADADDGRFFRTTYEKNIGNIYRLTDFENYNALAQCGFALVPSSVDYPSNLSVSVKMYGDTGDNIAWTHLSDIFLKHEQFQSYGIELRSTKGSIPLWSAEIGSDTAIQELLSSSYGVSLLTMGNNPVGHNAELYIYGNQGTYKQVIHDPLVVRDKREKQNLFYEYFHFSPNMKIGTFVSGLKTVNEWWRTGETITIGYNDYFRMGFYIRRDSNLTSARRLCLRMVVGTYAYYLKVYNSSDSNGSINVSAFGTLGPTSYDGSPILYCTWADFAEILGYGTEEEVTIQLCEVDNVTGAAYLMTPPIKLTLIYNGTDVRDEMEFPPIPEPDWSEGFEIQ